MDRGKFISFEGSEGGGKTTQAYILAESLRSAGYDVLTTREPGGTPLGTSIRELLMHAKEGHGMCPETELLLFAADRAQHVREVIAPALSAGKIVLCDRYCDSTTVYQGVARALAPEQVAWINAFATQGTLPDLTFVLDLPAADGLARARSQTGTKPDRMEQEALSFYRKVRQGFLDLAQAEPARFRVIDAKVDSTIAAAAILTATQESLSL